MKINHKKFGGRCQWEKKKKELVQSEKKVVGRDKIKGEEFGLR